MKNIKMVAKLGDQQIPMGVCSPAQARILVKEDLAAWQDGSIILFVRNAHASLLANNPDAWVCESDDRNVSKAEIDRRKTWFNSLMPKAVTAFTEKRGSEKDIIHEEAYKMANCIGGGGSRGGYGMPFLKPRPMAEVDGVFNGLWESSPDVSVVFECMEGVKKYDYPEDGWGLDFSFDDDAELQPLPPEVEPLPASTPVHVMDEEDTTTDETEVTHGVRYYNDRGEPTVVYNMDNEDVVVIKAEFVIEKRTKEVLANTMVRKINSVLPPVEVELEEKQDKPRKPRKKKIG